MRKLQTDFSDKLDREVRNARQRIRQAVRDIDDLAIGQGAAGGSRHALQRLTEIQKETKLSAIRLLKLVSEVAPTEGKRRSAAIAQAERAIEQLLLEEIDELAIQGPFDLPSPLFPTAIDDAKSSVAEAFADYRRGWTAPQRKPWHERWPVSYALLLLLAGAVIGAILSAAVAKIADRVLA